MKKDMWIVWVCLLGMVFLVGDVQADPPYGITLTHIKFNHDTSDDETDGVTIQKNKSDITAPEWVTRSQTNKAVAYVKGGVGKIILARFTCTSDTVTSAKIFATKTAGTYFADIGEKTITFSNGVSSPEYQQFTVTNVPTSVRKTTVTWQWKFKSGGSDQNITSTGPHTIYVILASPQAPMTKPWTEVLDDACNWANGQTSAASAASQITSSLYTSGFNYETVSGAPRYGGWTQFNLTLFVSELGSSYSVNCLDMGKAVTTYGNAIGCGLGLTTYGAGGNPIDGPLNCIDPIGTPSPTNNPFSSPLIDDDCRVGGFSYHAFSQKTSNNRTWDATLKYDTDSDPDNVTGSNPGCGTTTTGHSWTLPTNEVESTFISRLVDAWPREDWSPTWNRNRSFSVY